jgi:hypothetical protein
MSTLFRIRRREPAMVQLASSTPATSKKTGVASGMAADISAADGNGGGNDAVRRASASAAPTDDGAVLNDYVDRLYAAYRPPQASYEAQDAKTLSAQIAAWLRPGYERAMEERRAQTAAYRAELDADAIARGMGSSTYVTDVKSRQLSDEAADVAALESEYGAQLGKLTMEAVEAEREREMEVALFNREQDREAYMQAYRAALSLYEAYLDGQRGGRSGSRTKNDGSDDGKAATATTQKNCERFLAGLTPAQRYGVYTGTDEENARYRSEILASVGRDGYLELMEKYPF